MPGYPADDRDVGLLGPGRRRERADDRHPPWPAPYWAGGSPQAIVAAYDELAAEDPSHMQTPFVAVHRVRAHAAHAAGVTRALVNRVLADLVDGAFPEIPVQAAVFVGSTTRLPDSEPAVPLSRRPPARHADHTHHKED